MQSADFAVLLTNSTANGGVGGQVDGVDPMRNPRKLRVAWMSKNYNGAFIHELGHLFGARSEIYYHILYHLSKLKKRPCPALSVMGLIFCVITCFSTVILDLIIRHDRDGDSDRFKNAPQHGFFINSDRQNLTYTIMATGDDVELEDGRLDRGLGRISYFSAPREQYGRTLGNSKNDNTRIITTSRDTVQ